MKKLSLIVSLFCLISLAVPDAPQAGSVHPDLRAAVRAKGPGDAVPVIITLSDRIDPGSLSHGYMDRRSRRANIISALRTRADETQGPLNDFLGRKQGKKIKRFWVVNAMAATVPASSIDEIAQQPGVASVMVDTVINAPVPQAAPEDTPEWNISRIGAKELWDLGITGAGVVVANMDSGVDYLHPDLNSRWRGGANSWFDPNGQHILTPFDAGGHGTGTMGVMVGGDAGPTAIGVAPDARWIAVKIFPDTGDSSLSVILAGFQWLLDPDGNPATDDAPDVINNSWGFDASHLCLNFQDGADDFSLLPAIINALKAAQIAVVFSAGNSGPFAGSDESPANYANGYAVGATDINNAIAGFSSRGPSACTDRTTIFPDVVAPGVSIRTADLTSGGVLLNSYQTVNGTSFSAPHVAGAMALLRSAFPDLTVAELESALRISATDLGAAGADTAYGRGLINVRQAFNSLLTTHFILLSPAAQEVVPSGTIKQVSWALPTAAETFTIKYAPDGITWLTQGTVNAPETTFDWQVPPPIKNRKSALIKVVAKTAGGTVVGKATSAPFTVEVVKLDSPNDATPLLSNDPNPVTISWTVNATKRPVAKTVLEYTKDGGVTWIKITSFTDRPGPATYTFDWDVPAVVKEKTQSKVRVRLVDAQGLEVGRDASDVFFSILP